MQQVVYRNGSIVPLPPKSVAILILLVEHAGEVVDKSTIFSTIWPETFVVDSSLTKNISLLRKTLQSSDGEPVIETVSKRGYRFAAVVHPPSADPISDVAAFALQPPRPHAVFRPTAAVVVALLMIAASGCAIFRPSQVEVPLSAGEREYRIARHIWSRMDRAEIAKVLTRFEHAIALEPQSAVAHAGVAEARATMVTFAVGSPRENLDQAYRAAQKAIKLDSRRALPHVSLGVVLLFRDFDTGGAERAYRRALELEPDSVPAHFRYACLLAYSGRTTEARALLQRAERMDPVSPLISLQAARVDYLERRYEAANQRLAELLEREPGFGPAHYYRALALGQLGRTGEARAHLRQAGVHDSLFATENAWLHAVDGDSRPARELLNVRTGKVAGGSARPTVLLMPAVIAGEKAIAFDAIERMWQTREVELLSLRADPRFDTLRREPRFEQLVSRIWTR